MKPFVVAAAAVLGLAAPPPGKYERRFNIDRAGEVRILVRAGCPGCDWAVAGREAAVLSVSVDAKYSQHLTLARGEESSDYPISLGPLPAGEHRLTIEPDVKLSAPDVGAPSVDVARTDVLYPGSTAHETTTDFLAQSMAPIVYARPNTVGRFTDLPLLMWYEIAPTPHGRQFRYSVIFSNEDEGTPTDRLMATWGRTTDIEYIYGVELDDEGRVVSEEFQGPGHEVPAFKGRHESRHPLLWVSTDNNMVSESGPTAIRYAPVPERFKLENVSREAVMDRNPWTYVVAAKELSREGKIDDGAEAGSGRIPDPRRFVHVEACATVADAAIVAGFRARDENGAARWYDSDRGVPEFRVARSGCFRAAVPMPAASQPPDAVRFRAFSKPAQGGARKPPSAVLTRVNSVFALGPTFLPQPSVFSRLDRIDLPVGGDWIELPFEQRR